MTVAELFTNPPTAGVSSPLAQLSVDITTTPAAGTLESYAVSAAAPLALRAASGRFRVLVDHEIMVVTASVSGSSPWEFERGAEGSTPAPHSSGAAIHHVLTAGALATKADLDSGTGLLSDSQTPAAVAATLAGLGSAATHPASDFDPAGAAASAQAAAEAASDPAGAAAAAAAAAQAAAEAASDPAGAAAAAQAAAEAASDPAGSAAAAQAAAITAAEAASLPVGTTLDQVPGAAGDVSLHGHRITSLAAATAGTDALNRDTGDGRYPQRSATAGGALTPTATRTSTIDVPVLRDFVSVMDFAAKGDAKQVTDATIASGTNQLHSAAAIFTAPADVGKRVMVVGAGAASGMLTGYIGSVSGGVASLVTTAGGSTPANASTTISSGGTVNYGTLDTAAVQGTVNAVSTAGGGMVLIPAGFGFMLNTINPANNVTVWAYGATLYLDGSTTNGLFYNSTVGLSRWSMRGGFFAGTTVETQSQLIFNSSATATALDVRFYDLHVENWHTGPLYVRNPTRARAIGCTMLNLGAPAWLYNAINFVSDSTTAHTQELIARDNIIEAAGGEAISIVNGNSDVGSDTRYVVTGNICSTGVGSSVIAAELSGTTSGTYAQFTIANNQVTQTGSGGNQFGITLTSAGGNTDPYHVWKGIVQGNTVNSSSGGIQVSASDTNVGGNEIYSVGSGIYIPAVGTIAVTGTTTNGSAAVSGVTGGSAVINGTPITGTGITNGTFLLSGAGTSAWTLSLPATGANTGLTAQPQLKNLDVNHNLISASANPTNYLLSAVGVRNSSFTNNRVMVAAGSSATTFSGMRFSLCGWVDVLENKVWYAPRSAIHFVNGNDFDISNNRLWDPSEGGAGFAGITVGNISGTVGKVKDNTIVDDRGAGAQKMTYGVDVATATNNQVLVTQNEMHGYTGARSINGQCAPGSIRNSDDQYPGGPTDILISTSNANWPIPAGSTLLDVVPVGGGGGGGGGGTPSSSIAQVGGSGGAAGTFTSVLMSVGSATTATVTIGAGGNGGNGAAAGGNAGSDGTGGGVTTFTMNGVTAKALGGGRGLGANASTTTSRQAFVWGSSSAGSTGVVAGGAGGGSSTAGGDSFGYIGGGGAGGGSATVLLGGGAGTAGALAGNTSVGGTTGASATAAGVSGVDAAANSGAGGPGGGAGSFNGGAGGAGGNGAKGGSGYVRVRVVA